MAPIRFAISLRTFAVFALLLQGASAHAGPHARISIADDPSIKEGNPNLVLIEIADFQCPVCARAAATLMPVLYDDLVKSGQVEIVFLDFPLPMHPYAFQTAQAAACAGEQGKYWEMHNELFGNQTGSIPARLPERAQEAGLDVAAFQKCLAGHKHDGAIREDMRTVSYLGIHGTPDFLIARRVDGGNKVEVLEQIEGLPPVADLEAKIRAHLAVAPDQ